MPPQQFYQPGKRSSRDDGMYNDESSPLGLPDYKPKTPGVSKEETKGVMDNIDSALAENDVARKDFSGGELESGEQTADEGTGTLAGEAASKESDLIERLGKGYTGNMASNAIAGTIAGKLGSRRRLLVGGGVGAGITGLLIAGFFALLPLKLNHIVDNLQDTFFASTEEATDRWSEKLFEAYIRKHILPDLGSNCGSTIDRNCVFNNNIDRGSVAGRLFQGWRDSKLENKLATKYGVEFSLDRGRNQYFMKVNGQNINITSFKNNPNISLRDVDVGGGNRNDIRRAWKNALHGETRFKRALYRYKVGNLLERKYGVRRCVIACGTRDNFDDWRDNKSKAFKVLLVERVLVPRTDTLGILIQCIMIGGCESFKDTDQDGNRRDGFQKTVGDNLDRLRARIGIKAVNELVDEANKYLERGITASLIDKMVTVLLKEEAGDVAGRAAGKALPIIGWIDFAAQVSKTLVNSQQNFRRWAYITNATAAVGLYMMYRSHVDEIRAGNVDSEMVGSFVSALGETGLGNAPAETAPLYSEILGSGPSTQSAFSRFFDGTAYAQTTGSTDGSQYISNGGDVVTTRQRIAPEDSLNSNGFINSALGTFNNPQFAQLSGILGLWDKDFCPGSCTQSLNGLYDGVGNAIGGFFAGLPGISDALNSLTGALGSIFGPFVEWIGGSLVPSPWPDRHEDISGAKVFTEMAKGGDEAGNYSAHMTLGAKAVSDQEANQIRASVENEHREEFAALPFTDRLFSKDDKYSLVSRVALSMPTNTSLSIQTGLASLVSNPFSRLAGSFSSVFSGPKVSAATNLPDAFGIKQYAIPLNDPVYSIDPDSLTDSYCQTFTEQWVQDVTIDERTGQDVHNRVNPCKLNEATAVGLGALYTDAVLEPEDRVSGSATVPTSNPADCPTAPVGIEQTVMVQGIRVHTCIADNVDRLLNAARAAGVDLGGSGWRDTNRQIELRRAHCGTSDYAIYQMPARECSPPTARPGVSRHEYGLAIDFTYNGATIRSSSNNGFRWLAGNASTYGFSNLPSEPWHWSTDGR